MITKYTQKEIAKMTTQEASAAIAKVMNEAEAAVRVAEQIADVHDLEFSMDLGGYGMGGWYESGEWQASSQSC